MTTDTTATEVTETPCHVGMAPNYRAGTRLTLPSGDVFIEIDGVVHDLCTRCGGTGQYASPLDAARCWDCRTTGTGAPIGDRDAMLTVAARRARDRAAYARRKTAKEQAERAAFTEWADQHADLLTALAPYAEDEDAALRSPTLVDFARQVRAGRRPLSDKQLTLTVDLLARDREDQAAEQHRRAVARYAAPVGEQATVTGTVKVAMDVDTRFGYCRLVIVEGSDADEGITVKVFGNSKAMLAVQRGDHITITGAVKAHETYDDVPQTVLTRTKVGDQS